MERLCVNVCVCVCVCVCVFVCCANACGCIYVIKSEKMTFTM